MTYMLHVQYKALLGVTPEHIQNTSPNFFVDQSYSVGVKVCALLVAVSHLMFAISYGSLVTTRSDP